MSDRGETSTSGPSASFVRDTYNATLTSLPTSYGSHRWEIDSVAKEHFRQTSRALIHALRGIQYSRALEIGGGDGVWTQYLLKSGAHVDFLDISEEMIAGAKKRLTNFSLIRYIQGDFQTYAVEPQAYDLVISVRNIEYMQDKNAAVENAVRALRPGGSLIIVTKDPAFDRDDIQSKTLHTGKIAASDLVEILESHGFVIEFLAPAIIGKGLKYGILRVLCNTVQLFVLALRLPYKPFAYFSESYIVRARKA